MLELYISAICSIFVFCASNCGRIGVSLSCYASLSVNARFLRVSDYVLSYIFSNQLPTERVEEAITAKLPTPVTVLPREKRVSFNSTTDTGIRVNKSFLYASFCSFT